MINSVDTYFIDHFFGSQSAFLDHLALTATNSLLWVPFYVLLAILVIKNHDSMSQIAICVGCAIFAVLFATGLTSIVTKPLVERLRPCNDPEFKYLVQIAGDLHNKDFSFFSSHAATTMALATFFSFLVRSGLMTCSMFLWSLLMCWTRLYLGQHFFTDILWASRGALRLESSSICSICDSAIAPSAIATTSPSATPSVGSISMILKS